MRAEIRRLNLIEWRFGGHRRAYARAIVTEAQALGIEAHLHTTAKSSTSIGNDADAFSTLSVHIHDEDEFRGRRLISLLRRTSGRDSLTIVPEADRVAPLLAIGRILRLVRSPLVVVFMRPPRWHSPSAVSTSILKLLSIVTLSLFRTSIDVLFLDDPLARPRDRAWRLPTWLGEPLWDPADLVPIGQGRLPPELSEVPPATPVVCAVGTMDQRKRIPLIVTAWSVRDPGLAGVLVIAGAMGPALRTELAQAGAYQRGDVIIIDRYLTDAEFDALVTRAIGLFALQGDALSSGTILSAAARNTWVITVPEGRRAQAAQRAGVAISAVPTPHAIASAIAHTLRCAERPAEVRLPTASQFGGRILASARRANRGNNDRTWT